MAGVLGLPGHQEDIAGINGTASHWLYDGRDLSGRPFDIEIVNGTIARIAPAGTADTGSEGAFSLQGRLVLPGLIDGHLHLDKTFHGMAWQPHSAGPNVLDRIENEARLQAMIEEPIRVRAGRLAQLCVTNGTLALRTHVDIDETKRLKHLHEVLHVREQYRDLLDIQIVAFPQSGVVRQPQVPALLDHAIAEGAELIGGLDPATIDKDVDGQLDAVFGLAERRGVGVDLHLHNTGEVGIGELEEIARRTASTGMQGMVTVSHAYCLGSVERGTARRMADRLAEAGISVVTACPGLVALPPLDILRDAGVVVFAGSDNVRDAWSPFGNADMLERLMLIAYRSGYRRDEDIEATLAFATSAAANALGLKDYGLKPGNRADLVAVDAHCLAEAIVARPSARMVFKSGRLVARDGRFLGMSQGDPRVSHPPG